MAQESTPEIGTEPQPVPVKDQIGLVLTGGGARGAYQVGVLSYLARKYPDLQIPIITGVSAGAVNAAQIAGHPGTFQQAAAELRGLWGELTTADVFNADAAALGWTALRTSMRLMSGGLLPAPAVRALLETQPLRELLTESLAAVNGELTGIEANLIRGKLNAAALITTSYTTGQTVVWVQSRDDVPLWNRPQRLAIRSRLTVEHVMASAALPLFFPAVRIGNAWYGDGGVRLAAPLSPALHLGATRVLAVSTRFARSQEEAEAAMITRYPPPAQILGIVMNAIFLDVIDQDAMRLQRINRLLEQIPEERRDGMKPIKLLVIRPSRDLGRLVAEYEPKLPPAFKFMTRGLGTRETKSPDLLSMLMFQPDYLTRLIEIGEEDAEARADELAAFFAE